MPSQSLAFGLALIAAPRLGLFFAAAIRYSLRGVVSKNRRLPMAHRLPNYFAAGAHFLTLAAPIEIGAADHDHHR